MNFINYVFIDGYTTDHIIYKWIEVDPVQISKAIMFPHFSLALNQTLKRESNIRKYTYLSSYSCTSRTNTGFKSYFFLLFFDNPFNCLLLIKVNTRVYKLISFSKENRNT